MLQSSNTAVKEKINAKVNEFLIFFSLLLKISLRSIQYITTFLQLIFCYDFRIYSINQVHLKSSTPSINYFNNKNITFHQNGFFQSVHLDYTDN